MVKVIIQFIMILQIHLAGHVYNVIGYTVVILSGYYRHSRLYAYHVNGTIISPWYQIVHFVLHVYMYLLVTPNGAVAN